MKYNFNYIEHYKIDAKEFDYFEKKDFLVIEDERRVHQAILENIDEKDKLILDIGSGNGWLSKELKDKEKTIVSTDISIINLINIHKLTGNSFNIVTDGNRPAFKNNVFDCIVASEIIEHTLEPGKFLSELFNILKPNGKLILTTPYKEKIRYSLCIHCNKKTPVNAHLHSFDEIKLQTIIDKKRVKIEKYHKFGNKALNYLRIYYLLRFLPFSLWKNLDSFINIFLPYPSHIVVIYKKLN